MAESRRTGRWPARLKARVDGLRAHMVEQGLDAFLINHPHDIRYLTGFGGEDSWAVVTRRGLTILSDSRFEEELGKGVSFARSVMRKKPLAEELAKVLNRHRTRRIGLQSEHLTVAARKAIVKQVGAKRLKDTRGWLIEQRAVKDDFEVRLIRKAIDIQQRGLAEALGRIKPGMTEKQACAVLEFHMKSLGADGPSFPTIVAAGANSSLPHYRPGETKIRARQPVLIDFGAYFKGYCSDMTRVVGFGGLPPKVREIYKIVKDAQQAGIEAIEPGAPYKQVDKAARDLIRKSGYGKNFGHGLGHGIGVEIHEEPRLSWLAEGELEPGNVVTVEPGIYLPGIGGVRIEDDILVTERGYRNLCTLPADLESAII